MDDGVTLPARRASHKQPSGTLGPKLLSGHLTAVQLKEKYGAEDVAVTEPEKPARQTQPSATLMPVLLVGQPTGSQDTTCCEVEFRGENPGSQEQSPETHMKPQEETKKRVNCGRINRAMQRGGTNTLFNNVISIAIRRTCDRLASTYIKRKNFRRRYNARKTSITRATMNNVCVSSINSSTIYRAQNSSTRRRKVRT